MKNYKRKKLFDSLWRVLHCKPNLIQAVVGPRQVGKTTLAMQILDEWNGNKIYEAADLPQTPSSNWIAEQWLKARLLSKKKKQETLLILDEIQKIPRWSEIVKKLYDEDHRNKTPLRAVLLGSSALLMQRGLTESLAGRFELHRHYQWSFSECRECFSLNLNEYLYFGGYPGALPMRKDEERWMRYIRDSLIETVLSKDVLLMSPVTKPALLRQTFGLAVAHPAEIVSYQKMLGQLQDAGNATTLVSFLKLLSNAFLAGSLERWSGSRVKQKGSIPKLLVFDNAIISAMRGRDYKTTKADKVSWGRMVENAAGARLYLAVQALGGNLFYWRERQLEVDFVIQVGSRIIALEIKSGADGKISNGINIFVRRYKNAEGIIVSNYKNRVEGKIKQIRLKDFFAEPLKSIGL